MIIPFVGNSITKLFRVKQSGSSTTSVTDATSESTRPVNPYNNNVLPKAFRRKRDYKPVLAPTPTDEDGASHTGSSADMAELGVIIPRSHGGHGEGECGSTSKRSSYGLAMRDSGYDCDGAAQASPIDLIATQISSTLIGSSIGGGRTTRGEVTLGSGVKTTVAEEGNRDLPMRFQAQAYPELPPSPCPDALGLSRGPPCFDETGLGLLGESSVNGLESELESPITALFPNDALPNAVSTTNRKKLKKQSMAHLFGFSQKLSDGRPSRRIFHFANEYRSRASTRDSSLGSPINTGQNVLSNETRRLSSNSSSDPSPPHCWHSRGVLAKGGYGEVHLAYNPKLQESAIKVIKISNRVMRRNAAACLANELQFFRFLCDCRDQDPPFICRPTYDADGENGCFWLSTSHRLHIATEWYPGGDLIQYAGKVRIAAIRTLTVQLAIAIEWLHAHKIVHHDLKLENVLVDEHGNCVITDFGAAKRMADGQRKFYSVEDHPAMCTPQYAAPEVTIYWDNVARVAEYGFGIDWWALGVLLFEMHTGRELWSGYDTTEIETLNRYGPPPDMREEMEHFRESDDEPGDDFYAFVDRLLDPDPQSRMSAKEARTSNFTKPLHWEAVRHKQVPPPIDSVKVASTEPSSPSPSQRWRPKDNLSVFRAELHKQGIHLKTLDLFHPGPCQAVTSDDDESVLRGLRLVSA